ncbi:hypothetical protein ACFYST_06080 [Kitasatospora sp. NPDC004614]|uniref:hypothetical protein n=1 Tax=unclassified Kitasatospora TaxID=2633591 RepID=UPI0036A16E73
MRNENMIAGLLRERESYERRGLANRVALVDEQLAYYGHTPLAAAAEDAGDPVPEGRTADAGQQTADGADADEVRRGRGRPKLPRDAAGNIVRS